MFEKDIFLPAEFIENRIIVQPKTWVGTTIRFLTDTGGGCFITPKAAKKANLSISEGVMDGSRRDLADPPTFRDSDWIPPLIIKGENAKYPIIDYDQIYFKEQNLDGLIGQAWFANRVWTFDYIKKKMVYHTQWESNDKNIDHSAKLGFQEDSNNVRNNHFPQTIFL